MKHLKKFQIFENTSTDSNIDDEINDVLVGCLDYGYSLKVYNYYQDINDENKSGYLFKNKSNVNENTHIMKLVKISKIENHSTFYNIDDYQDLGFNSSGFDFSTITKDSISFYMELFNSLSHFEDYKPKVQLKNDSIMVLLNIGKSSEDDIKSTSNLNSEYEKLYEYLYSFSVNKSKVKLKVDYNHNVLKIKSKSDEYISTVLASLCTQMSEKEAFSWMKNEDKIEDLTKIRDIVNEKGYFISFKSSYNDEIILELSKK